MEIHVKNWDRLQDRPGDPKRKNYVWFKFYNDLPMDDGVALLPLSAKWLFVLVLCEANRKGSATFSAQPRRWTLEGIKNVDEMLQELAKNGLIELITGNDPVIPLEREREREREAPGSGGEILKNIWNENRDGLPSCEQLSPERRVKAQARWKENPDSEYWIKVVKTIASDPFMSGTNDRGWKANFDYFIRPGTHLKISEGHYGGKKVKRLVLE